MSKPNPTDADGIETVTPDELRSGTVNTYDGVAGHTVDVRGHRYDVADHRLPLRIVDDDGEVTILVESDMRADPVEGVQGSYVIVTRAAEPCADCGHDWERVTYKTMAGLGFASCAACGRSKGEV